MRQIILPDFDLILSADVRDIFKWFGVNSLSGVTYAEATFMEQFNEGFCSMVNHHPEDVENTLQRKPFIFLNTKELTNVTIHESAIIIQRASFQMSTMLKEESDSLDEIYDKSEDICFMLIDELKFPKVFHKI